MTANLSLDFRSDNVTGAAPQVLEAIRAANAGHVGSYGADPWTERLAERFSALFEREVAVFPVATGTAANVLGLSLLTPPWGAVFCHAEAHIQVDECGGPELFTGGAKLVPLAGKEGKLQPAELEAAIIRKGDVHAVQPAAVSLTQASECGTVYRLEELQALATVARRHKLALHMDGARFANAVAALGCRPAEITWQAGIEVLSFGASKNGCLAAEAIVLFDPSRSEELAYRRKRGGHLFSKMRFLSAQLDAYLEDDLWLVNARHANAMAARLAEVLTAAGGRLLHPVDANEVILQLPDALAKGLKAEGALFYDWEVAGPGYYRFVTAFDTQPEAIEQLAALAQRLAA